MTIKKLILKVEKRKVLGRKVKDLRKEGILPASVYGRKMKSINLQGGLKEVLKVFDKVGETGLIELQVKGIKEAKIVLLKNPQYDPVSDQLIHVDFHKVDLTEKVKVNVPIDFVGEAPAVKAGGVLVHVINELEIEALPTDLLDQFIVDISKLKKIEDAITVADLKIDKKKITLSVDEGQVLAKVEAPKEEEEEPTPVPEEEGEEEPVGEGEEKKEEGAEKEKEAEDSKEKQEKETKTK